jgi:transposase-like protein
MAQNKVQYQKGLSMPEFFELYGSPQQCETLVRAWRWPRGFTCPPCKCGWHSEFRRQDRLYFQCSGCRYQCSLVSGTIFESSKLPLPKWFLAMHLMTQAKNNVSALELKRHLGVSYPTAWLLKHKIMDLMGQREQWRQLTGRVEIDDAYLGGEVHGSKPGRGSPNKIPFVAAVQTTESGHAQFMCLSQRPFTKESIQEFADKSLLAPATLVSDGLGCFTAVRGTGILHEPHVTGGGASSAKNPDFWAVNT